MPFPFVYVCDLLEDLAHLSNRIIPLLPQDLDYRITEITLRWLKHHRSLLDAASTDDDAVILTFQPEKRVDRAYGLDPFTLEQVIARVLNLPKQHHQDLQRWRHEPAHGDLASSVERVMENMITANHRVAIRAQAYAVTVEHVDHSLIRIASHNQDSSVEVRSLALEEKNYDAIDILGDLYQRLTSREAKWLTRLILKDYGAVRFPDSLICQSNHSFLPRCVQVRAQFSSSIPAALRHDGPGSLRLAEVLKSANINLPTPPPTAPEPLSHSKHTTSRGEGSFHSPSVKTKYLISTRRPNPSIVNNHISKGVQPLGPQIFCKGTSKCLLTEHACSLSNCLFILAPCISTTLWLIENLLPWHGVSYVTSLQAFSTLTLPRRCPQTGKKYRKIALIETRRSEESAEFLKGIGDLNFKTPQGEKQWVEVYDWRILECIGKVDQGKELTYDPWQRCWIVAV